MIDGGGAIPRVRYVSCRAQRPSSGDKRLLKCGCCSDVVDRNPVWGVCIFILSIDHVPSRFSSFCIPFFIHLHLIDFLCLDHPLRFSINNVNRMKSSFLLLPPLLRVILAAETFPYLNSAAFDDGSLGAYPNQTYVSAPNTISPRLNVLQSSSRCDDGLYTMISLRGDQVDLKGQSPMILDGNGSLVWMNATYGETFGLGVQTYKGKDYLTFWQGDDSVGGHGEGYYFLVRAGLRPEHFLIGML